jgi:basic membrane lipoprotein Med (substrate-binding protein (PBP1-ABC) superfamily)
MFNAIKRYLASKNGILFDSNWENLDTEEKLSIVANSVSELEMTRILSQINKGLVEGGYNWKIENIDNIQILESETGYIFFKSSTHPLLFFREKDQPTLSAC